MVRYVPGSPLEEAGMRPRIAALPLAVLLVLVASFGAVDRVIE